MSKPGKDNPIIKPLLAIPIVAIQSISRVSYDLPIKKSDKRGKELSKHQFEFFLKEDFIDYFLSPGYERHFSPDGKRFNIAIKQLEIIQEKKEKK